MRLSALALISILSLILAACGWNPFHKMYSATAELRGKAGAYTAGQVAPTFSFHDGLQPLDFMQSSEFLVPIIKELKLDRIWAKRFKLDHEVMSTPDALAHLHQVLEMKVVPGTDIFKITAYSEVPQEAADIANAIVESDKAQSLRYAHDHKELDDDVRIISRAVPPN